MSLIGLLVTLLVLVVVLWAARAILGAMELPAPIATVVYVVIVLVCLLYLLQGLGGLSGGPILRWHG